jgi:hypothetical protein
MPKTKTADEAFARCTVSKDEYKKIVHVWSGRYLITGTSSSTCELGAMKPFSETEISYGVTIIAVRPGWAFFESATDSEGHALSGRRTDDRVDGTWVIEEFTIIFDPLYLQTHVSTGLNFRIDGQRDSMVVVIPPHVVAGFLARVDSEFRRGAK